MYGFGNNKRIVLFDTLKNQVDTPGIVAILAHELGHWKMSRTLKNIVFVESYLLAYVYLFGFFLNTTALYISFGFPGRSEFIGLLLFGFIFQPVDTMISFLRNMWSRHCEYQADAFAVNLGYNLNTPLIKLFEKKTSPMSIQIQSILHSITLILHC